MRISKAHTFLVLALTACASTESVETGVTIPDQQICDQQCYAAYRYLMGDELEDTGYHSASHQNTAETVCASEQCSKCEFCDLGLPILSLQNVELNRMANAEARMEVIDEESKNCMDCQWYLDNCERPDGHNVEYQRARQEDEPPYLLHGTDHRVALQRELSLCTDGPTHCGVNGECERRICKDFAARTGFLQPAHTLECKDCFKLWVECIHDRCFPPTHDAFADRLPGLDCFEDDVEECQQYSWQDLNARVAPDQECVARCWAKAPTHCHTGSCALTVSASTMQGFTAPLLTPAQQHVETLARGCNTFRNTCLETCDLGKTYSKCMKNCKELHETFPNHRQRCEETCEERTCGDECRDMTCCIGPEQCREGGEAHRCTKKRPSCGRYNNMEDSVVLRNV